MTRVLTAPGTSRKAPRLTLAGRPATGAVPLRVILPTARGVPEVGRTRTFCQVNCDGLPEVVVTVETICVAVTEVTLPWTGLLPEQLILILETVGAVPPTSKT